MKRIYFLSMLLFFIGQAFAQKTIFKGPVQWVHPKPTENNYNRLHTVDITLEVKATYQENYSSGASLNLNSSYSNVKIVKVIAKDGKIIPASSIPANIIQEAEKEIRFHVISYDVNYGGKKIITLSSQGPINYFQLFGEKPNNDKIAENRTKVKNAYDSGLSISNIKLDFPTVHSSILSDYINGKTK